MEITKEYLLEEYVRKGRRLEELLDELGCDYQTFNRVRRRLNIKRGKAPNIIGKNYGDWEIIQRLPKNTKVGAAIYLYKCKCGITKEKTISGLLQSNRCEPCGRINSRSKEIFPTFFWNKCKREAKKRNIEFTITKEYAEQLLVSQNYKCALTGLPIRFSETIRNKNRTKTISLDRIDSNLGYIEGNCQFVHRIINFMKQSYAQDEFIKWCKLITEYNEANHPEKYL